MARRGDYGKHREAEAEASRERSAKGREIGPLPAVAHPRRRARCKKSLLDFCKTYFPARFPLPFADCHREAAARLEACAKAGGDFACAMPRGSGKSTEAECAVLWAILYGYRRFVLLLQATQPLASASLHKLQRELETNDLLGEDFPEACYPIRKLERIHNRAKGQTLDGRPTRIEWTADGVTLPDVPGAACSGAVLRVAGITGAVRGLSVAGPAGEVLRPDFVVLDDVQTRESARSPSQTAERESVITGDVMGLAGPTTTIAAVMLCTVIYPNDLSDRFLLGERHPEWQAVRTRRIESWPEDMALWDRYADIRRESLRSGDEGRRAGEFYAENREAMDRGGVVSWPERMKAGELSGLQSAMNDYIKDPAGFMAEHQNDPKPAEGAAGAKEFDPADVRPRLSGLDRYSVPREASRVTCFIDLGAHLHWYAVVAWDEFFGGSVVDYGCYPRQPRAFFSADDARPTLGDLFPQHSESQRVYAGLDALAGEVLGRAYPVQDGVGESHVDRCLVDSGKWTQTVYQWCRATTQAARVLPSKGIGRTQTSRGVAEWRPRPGEQSGFHWRLTAAEVGRGKMVQFDPDAWKTFLHERLTTAPGGRGCLTLFGRDPFAHEMLSEHLAAEAAEPRTIRGQTFDKWAVKPHRPDNHLLDCLVGATVAASVQGLRFSADAATGAPPERKPPVRVRLSELQQKRREGVRG